MKVENVKIKLIILRWSLRFVGDSNKSNFFLQTRDMFRMKQQTFFRTIVLERIRFSECTTGGRIGT